MKLIYETESPDFFQEINESSGEKKYKIKGVFSSPGQKNKNGRIYPMPLWEAEVAKYQDVIKSGHVNSLMELEHPARSTVDMMEAVARIDKLFIKDGYVMGEATLLNNPKANQLKTLIDAGIKMSVSTRGVGKVNNGIVEEYRLITTDIIPNLAQSDHNAEMMGIVEGVLADKEYMITEAGDIQEVEMCSESGCNLFEKADIEKAIKEKFALAMNEVKGSTSADKFKKAFLKDFNQRIAMIKDELKSSNINNLYGSIESLEGLLASFKKEL